MVWYWSQNGCIGQRSSKIQFFAVWSWKEHGYDSYDDHLEQHRSSRYTAEKAGCHTSAMKHILKSPLLSLLPARISFLAFQKLLHSWDVGTNGKIVCHPWFFKIEKTNILSTCSLNLGLLLLHWCSNTSILEWALFFAEKHVHLKPCMCPDYKRMDCCRDQCQLGPEAWGMAMTG